MLLGSIFTPAVMDGIILAILGALVASQVRVWILCSKTWEIHNVRDNEGRPVWYSQERSIEALSEILGELSKTTDKQCRLLDALVEKVSNLPVALTSELLRAGIVKG